MPEHKKVPVAKLKRDPSQPRKAFNEAVITGLADSLKRLGQLVPIIVYPDADGFVILDGESRVRAALLAGTPAELDAVVLPARPSPEELAVARAAIDVHRTNLNAIERSDQLALIQRLTGCTVTELAAKVSVSQSTVSKLLALQKLSPEARAKVAAGNLDVEKAALVASQADPAAQAALLARAATLTRDQLRRAAKPRATQPAPQERASHARFPLSAGLTVTVQGPAVTLDGAIDALADALKALKRGRDQGVGIDAMQKVMRDQARANEPAKA